MSPQQKRTSRLEPVRLMRVYVLVLGAGLLLDGGGRLLLDQLGIAVGFGTTDTWTNVLHLVSGLVLLTVGLSARGGAPTRVIWAALIFGAFYVALGVVGLTIDQPFGLVLGPGENLLHFTVGPLALALGAWALKTTHDRPAIPPVPIAAPLRRRRPAPERKRTSRRGKSRRR